MTVLPRTGDACHRNESSGLVGWGLFFAVKRIGYIGFLLGETMIALAIFFLLFLVISGATMSAYSNSVRMSHKARAEDVMSTALVRIQRDLVSWSPTRTESSSEKLGDITFQVTRESRTLPDDTLEVAVAVSWDYQGQTRTLQRTLVQSVEGSP